MSAIAPSTSRADTARSATDPSGTAPPAAGPRAGGVAALVKAATYLIGFGVMAAYLGPRGFVAAQDDPAASLAFLLDHQVAMYLWYLTLYLVGGVALAVLTLALHDRLRGATASLTVRTATTLGLTWSGLLLASGLVSLVGQRAVVGLAAGDTDLATSTWTSISVVQDALGGGIEAVGAVWVLLVAVAGIRTGRLGRGLGVLGLGIGAVGLGTLVPAATDAAASLFGVAFVVWFCWAAATLLRRSA